jgi:glycosidase
VVRRWLREGVDGWRLDVAHDIGFNLLQQLTDAAHAEKPGALVVGELWNYPREWFPSVDGVMNFTLREIVLRTARGQIPPATAGAMIQRVVDEAGIEPMLKSWLMLDNHDTQRLATSVPDERARRLAQLLQFTLPGAPNLYYGSELGMAGGDDPEMRAPMRWDLATESNATLAWTRRLIALHREHRALRIGNFRRVESTRLLAFERYTDRVEDTVIVVVNPSTEPVNESLLVANSKLMNASPVGNLLDAADRPQPFVAGLLSVQLPAGGVLLLAPVVAPDRGYTTYKRVQ